MHLYVKYQSPNTISSKEIDQVKVFQDYALSIYMPLHRISEIPRGGGVSGAIFATNFVQLITINSGGCGSSFICMHVIRSNYFFFWSTKTVEFPTGLIVVDLEGQPLPFSECWSSVNYPYFRSLCWCFFWQCSSILTTFLNFVQQ
jgi:hypothetical protein